MTRQRGILAYPFSLAAVLVFSALLVFALWRLLDQESDLRGTASDNMLWTVSQAQVAAYRLDAALGRARLGEVGEDTLRLRYNVLLSRIDLLEAGPQTRFLADLGERAAIRDLGNEIRAHERAFLAAHPAAPDSLHMLLDDFAEATGRAANAAMVAQLERIGGLLNRQHATILQVIAATLAIFAIGVLISWRMLVSLRAEHEANASLKREREMRAAYRGFVALVAHQFQTPLAAIDSSMQRILRKGEAMARDEIRARARRVRATVAQLTDLMRATRESVRLDAGQIEVTPAQCDLAAELDLARQSQLDAHPGRKIRISIDESVPATLVTDRVLMHQIVGNLLSNATAYSPQDEPVTVHVSASAGRVRIAVVDRGIGIPETESPMLFEPFFRASSTMDTHGSGMGLYLSRRLARLMGGEIRADSRPGIGSAFTLELPLQGTRSDPVP